MSVYSGFSKKYRWACKINIENRLAFSDSYNIGCFHLVIVPTQGHLNVTVFPLFKPWNADVRQDAAAGKCLCCAGRRQYVSWKHSQGATARAQATYIVLRENNVRNL